jgi:hypothetical protein
VAGNLVRCSELSKLFAKRFRPDKEGNDPGASATCQDFCLILFLIAHEPCRKLQMRGGWTLSTIGTTVGPTRYEGHQS